MTLDVASTVHAPSGRGGATTTSPEHGLVRLSPTDLIAAFLSGRSPCTIEAYRRDLADFATFAGVQGLDDAARLLLGQGHRGANVLALRYRTELQERGLSAATVSRRLAALRSLVTLARTLGLVGFAIDIRGLKAEAYRDTRGPRTQGVRSMLELLGKRQDAKGTRDRAIVRLLFDLGLRRAEVVGLDLEHLDLVAGTLSVLGKGRSGREQITLPVPTKEALREWLTARGEAPGPLFLSLDRKGRGGRLSGTSVYRLVRRAGTEVGLTARPHGLRHAAITEALELTNGNVRAVSRFSRHRDVRVLTRYDDNRTDLAGAVAALVASTVEPCSEREGEVEESAETGTHNPGLWRPHGTT